MQRLYLYATIFLTFTPKARQEIESPSKSLKNIINFERPRFGAMPLRMYDA